jgi:hypothetical protein
MTHHLPPTQLNIVGAALLACWALLMWGAVTVLMVADRRGRGLQVFRGASAVVLIGVLGQVGHLQEHVAQVGYWVQHPNSKPWMTPWGDGLARGFGQVDTARAGLGMEILHFLGNMIFLAGMAGVMVLTCRAPGVRARRWGRMGVWMQGLHGLEHLALTLSVWLGATRPIGVSTWFGTMQPGPGLWTYRIWWHFLANVAGSVIFAGALWHAWSDRKVIEASFAQQGLPPRSRRRRTLTPRPVLTATRQAGGHA